MRRLDVGDRCGIQFFERGLAETSAPGKAQRQRIVERLPAQSYLRDRDIGVVIQEGFVTPGNVDIEGVEARNRVLLAKDRNRCLNKNRVRFSASTRRRDCRIASDITVDVELIGI